MADASLYEIFQGIGALNATVGEIGKKVDEIKSEMHASEQSSAVSRANVHRRLDELVVRTTNIEADVTATKTRLDKVEEVTGDVAVIRERARGAGTLGSWLIKIGVGVVTLAGWIIGAYTYLTGRPPP